jgi:Mrp family chromosome partitioning ATPase
VQAVAEAFARGEAGSRAPLLERRVSSIRSDATEWRTAESEPTNDSSPPGTLLPIGTALALRDHRHTECFETLKANLWLQQAPHRLNAVLFVGAGRAVQPRVAAERFAASLALGAGARVLLLDASDDAVEHAHRACAGEPPFTLERLLADTVSLQRPVEPPSVQLLPVGVPRLRRLALYQSPAFDHFLQAVRGFFDQVVMCAPPITFNSEALILARKADAVALVIESERTRKQAAARTRQQVEEAGGKVVGVVLTERRYRVPGWLYDRL